MTSRLKSRLWVEALLRRCQHQGLFGAVLKIGADEAGAVYVVVNRQNGNSDVLGPPAGPSHDEQGNRQFRRVSEAPMTWLDAKAFIDRQSKFDSDIWVVEIEARDGWLGLQMAE